MKKKGTKYKSKSSAAHGKMCNLLGFKQYKFIVGFWSIVCQKDVCPSNDGSSERLIRKKIKPEIFSLDLSLIRSNNNPYLKSEKSWDFIYFQFHFHSFEIVLVRSLVWWVEKNFITVGFLGYSQVSWTLRLISKVKLLDFRAKSYRATSMQYWQKFISTVPFYFKPKGCL